MALETSFLLIEADWLSDGDFNRWIGGVHLHRGSMWRRDELIGSIQRA